MGGDYFALFGLGVAFELDGAELSGRYRALQAAAHPDRFAGGGEAERLAALAAASRINDGYRTLKDPLLRAAYMLSLQGVDALAESGGRMSAEFLVQQMEWRESLEALQGGGGDSHSRDGLRAEVENAEREVAARAGELLKGVGGDGCAELTDGEKDELADVIRRWHYIRKMLAEL